MSKHARLHSASIVILSATLILGMVYPYLEGQYDPLSVGLSTLIQVFAVLAVVWMPIGVLWSLAELRWAMRRKRALPVQTSAFLFGWVTVVLGSLIAILLAVLANFVLGKALALGIILAWGWGVWRVFPRLQALLHNPATQFNPFALGMCALIVSLWVVQTIGAQPLTQFSRARAIAQSSELIRDIEAYHLLNGSYPLSLLAVYADYETGVVGIPRYHYAPHGDAYMLFFEQPRFVLDDLGVREMVVYHPQDQHTMISHASWILLLPPSQLNRSQGWFASEDSPTAHWKYFWFD
ncbi:MAG: hypothetical protein ACOYLB_05455 [Phototrophicaceae bacterium]